MKIDRRDVLKGVLGGAASAGVLGARFGARAQSGLFRHGVASGDPGRTRVILWTRLSPAGAPESVAVNWIIARDRGLARPVRRGSARAARARGFAVKLDIGGLDEGPGPYYYAFEAGGERSPVGRTRLLPGGRVESLKLGLLACSNYNAGYFNACRILAQRDDLDAVLHLGDYIYEYADGVYGGHPARPLDPAGEIVTLADYRARYALYRSDPDLQALHAAHPVIAVWDDHEIANNSWRGGAENHSPEEGDFAARQRAARRAYFEWLPIRNRGNRIYRRFRFGDLAHLIMLDTRHDGRAQQLAYGDFLRPPAQEGGPPGFDAEGFSAALQAPGQRIWSPEQEAWAARALAEAAAGARWAVLGNQVTLSGQTLPDLAGLDLPEAMQALGRLSALAHGAGLELPLSLDPWSGYPASRAALYRAVRAAGGPAIVLTGDTHHAWAARFGPKQAPLGVEIGVPGVSSPGLESIAPKIKDVWRARFLEKNRNFDFLDPEHRGTAVIELSRARASVEWYFTGTRRRSAEFQRGPRLTVARREPARPRIENAGPSGSA